MWQATQVLLLFIRRIETCGVESLIFFAAFIYYFECLHKRTLYVFNAEGAVADVVGGIKWVQHNEGIWERPLGLLEFYVIAVEIVQVRLEAAAVEVEEAREVAAERLCVLLVEALEVRRHHQN